MEKIINWVITLLNKLSQKDKIYHIIINFIIVLFLGVIFEPTVGLTVALIVSLGKEAYDEYKPESTGWNWEDLLADVIGMVIGLLIVL